MLVVIGAGGMGQAIARRCGAGRVLLVADVDPGAVDAVGTALAAEGHHIVAHTVDVSDPGDVRRLAAAAAELGPVRFLVHTAGLSPAQAPAEAVVAVDLLGVALVLEEFGKVIAGNGAAVVIASMAGHLAPPMSREDERALALAPVSGLSELECVRAVRSGDSGPAYAFAKRANLVRVAAASVAWGRRGARVNSISPGIIATPMGREELGGPAGDIMRSMTEGSGLQRIGTPGDIAAAAEFLLGPQASFVTGTDLLVDGGVVGSAKSGGSVPAGPDGGLRGHRSENDLSGSDRRPRGRRDRGSPPAR